MSKQIEKAASDSIATATDFALETAKQIKEAIINVSPDALQLTLKYVQLEAIIAISMHILSIGVLSYIVYRFLNWQPKPYSDKDKARIIILVTVGVLLIIRGVAFSITIADNLLAAISPELALTGKIIDRVAE